MLEYLETLTDPKLRARARKSLETLTKCCYGYLSRHEWIERAVNNGYTVREMGSFGRSIVSPDGAFVEQARATKFALDYAEHLISARLA